MGYIVSFLSRLDAAIQRRFDSACFFLMLKFGIRKSMLRYFLYTLITVSCVGYLMHRVFTGRATAMDWVLNCGLVPVLIFGQHVNQQQDLQTEREMSIASAADELPFLEGVLLSAMKLFSGVTMLLYLTLLVFSGKYMRFDDVCEGIIVMSSLCWCYLLRTPMNPPAEKAREHVSTLQAAPAKS